MSWEAAPKAPDRPPQTWPFPPPSLVPAAAGTADVAVVDVGGALSLSLSAATPPWAEDSPTSEVAMASSSSQLQHPPPPVGKHRGPAGFRPAQDGAAAAAALPAGSATPNGQPNLGCVSARLRESFDKETLSYVLEDVRLSTLQRKLIRESSPTVSIALAYQISESIVHPDNRMYVKRATDVLCDAIIDVFYSKHGEQVKKESAVALGKIGFVLADQQDFEKFYRLLWEAHDKSKKETLQVYFLRSLVSFLRMRPNLAEQEIQRIMTDLQDLLEKTENGNIMLALVDSLQEVSKWRPKLFEPIFQDVVDILVGWHIDSSQMPAVRLHTSEVLLSWHSYWIIDMEFSSSLLRQFMEDMEVFSQDVKTTDSREDLQHLSERIISLVQVFNTVLSCLKSPHSTVSFLPPESSVWCETILDCFLTTLEKCFSENILIAGQHALILLLERIDSLFAQHRTKIKAFIAVNQDLFGRLSYSSKEAVIYFLTRMFHLVDQPLQNELLKTMLSPQSFVLQAMLSLDKRVRGAAVDLFRILLNSKNIIVLQEVYGHLISLFEESLHQLGRVDRFLKDNKFKDQRFTHRQLEAAFFFVLASLSQIIVAKGSVLSMWALDPSIFQLLNNRSGIHDAALVASSPWIHHAVVKTLFSHSCTHGFFVSSSSLISPNAVSSPNASYFVEVLRTMQKLLRREDLSYATRSLVLDWVKKLLDVIYQGNYTRHLKDVDSFKEILNTVLKQSLKEEKKEDVLQLLDMVQTLLGAFELDKLDLKLLLEMHSTFSIHLRSVWPQVRQKGGELLQKLPPLLLDWKQQLHEKLSSDSRLCEERRAILQTEFKTLSPNDFKAFIEAILKGPTTPNYHQEKVRRHMEMHSPPGTKSVSMMTNEDLRSLWIAIGVSQFCVNNKLKTPLGKPQDTLTTIERVIRNVLQSLQEVKGKIHLGECHKLLEFHRTLEVTLSNAFDGSAITLSPPSKTIATFFSANKKTCLEWLSRLRVAVIELAYIIGDFAYVVQNAYDILPRLAVASKTHALQELKEGKSSKGDNQVPLVVAYLASALARLGNSDGLLGLYGWCREKVGKKYRWVKCLADIVDGGAEKGIAQFQSILKGEMSQSSLGEAALSVVGNELFLGHLGLCQHEEFEAFMKLHREKFALKKSSLKEDCLKALSQFEDGTVQLAEWKEGGLIEMGDAGQSQSASTEELILSSHLLLLNAAACFQRNLKRLPSWSESEKLNKALKVLGENLRILMSDRVTTVHSDQQIAVMAKVNEELTNLIQHKPGGSLSSLLCFKERCHTTDVLLLIKKWSEYFVRYWKADAKPHFQISALNLEIARQARKEENFTLANYHLQRSLLGGSLTSTVQMPDFLKKLDLLSMQLSVERAASLRQCSKLCFLSSEKELAVSTACGIVSSVGAALYLQQQHEPTSTNPELLSISSRSLLSLSRWLREDLALLDKVYPEAVTSSGSGGGATVAHVLQLEQNLTGVLDFLPLVDSATDSEIVVGRLLRLAVVQSPDLAKLWHSFGEWALSLGEKVLGNYEKSGGISLTPEEVKEVEEVVPDAKRREEVLHLLQRCHLDNVGNAKVDSNRYEFMQNELRGCPSLRASSEDSIHRLHALWATVQKRAYFYHEIAVDAFFQYVALSDGGREDMLIVATLHLLQLTVKHALELQESLQRGLETTPSARWKAIIPQLFSRLNHPVQVVRSRISDLLCRIAKDFPHLIIFPAVVGAGEVTSATDNMSKLLMVHVDEDDYIDEAVESEMDKEEQRKKGGATVISEQEATLQGAYARIVEAMKKSGPTSVDQVKRLVDELQRISLLWDELWMGTLLQYSHDVGKRIKRMEDEAKRLELNDTLSEEEKKMLVLDKYNIIFRPLIYVLDKVHAMTSKEPETPHEKWFMKKYSPFIKSMMAKVKNPVNPGKPKESWGLLSQLQNNLGSKLQTQTNLKFSDVSPSLSTLKKSRIPMPGIHSQQNLTLEAIENNMAILLTKTKPKRIAFQGSDGRRYTYLFKGLEDLHLDERIMQFLSISNILMKKQKKTLKARHYTVIPLGPRSGLIQWVGGASPMFSLFKKWQQRQQLPSTGSDKAGGAANTKGAAFQKPAERFYSKVYPLLREGGVTNLDNRRAWPLAILKQVMQELVKETPSNILSQEVVFYSADASHWYSLVNNLTISFAVMSIIGYIIGLGDRHMDNLLLDLERGEIIHIDYNVCFEKGKNLRIPEQVPCRLTQNVVSIFGLMGVEGLFRNSCEAALEVLKKGRETLLTLLEAFVYDPLVDWTPGVDMGVAGAFYGGRQNDLGMDLQDKREMQSEITFSMFAVRVAEMKGIWMEHKVSLAKVVAKMEDGLLGWLDIHAGTESLTEFLSQMHHSMSVLKEAEANPNHRLYTLHSRYVEHSLMETAVQVSQTRIDSFVEETERWAHLHQRAVSAVTGQQLTAWTAEVTKTFTDTSATSRLVKEFLENAGQAQLLEQFETVEGSFCIGIEKLKQNLLACLQLLNHYFGVSSLYPRSYRQRHRSTLYVRWAHELSENFTVSKCQELAAEFAGELADESEERQLRQHHVAGVAMQMESWAREVEFRLQNVFQRMSREKIEGSAQALAHLSATSLELQQYLANESQEVKHLLGDLFVGHSLTQVCRKFVTLETAAQQAEDGGFLDVTSDNGEWFLADEIHMQIGLITQILDAMDILGLYPHGSVSGNVLHKLHAVIKQLQHFNTSFFGIVLPEGLKSFQNEDPSAMNLALQLNGIISDAGLSLEELIQELQVEIRYAASGMPSANEATVSVARSVKLRYLELICQISGQAFAADKNGGTDAGDIAGNKVTVGSTGEMSSGQMLLLAFDTLFNNVDSALCELRAAAAEALQEVPEEWVAGIDVVAKADVLTAESIRPDLIELLDLTTFMNRLLVIKEYFSMCTRSATIFRGYPDSFGQLLPTGDEIARPVKLFLAEFYKRQVIGAGSTGLATFLCQYMQQAEPSLLTNLPEKGSSPKLSLEELAKAFMDRRLALPGKDRSRFLLLELDNLVSVMRRLEVAKYLEQNVEALQSSLQINQLQRNSFQWFHDGLLPPSSEITVVQPTRQNFLAELNNYIAVLLTLNEEVTTGIQSRYHELNGTVEQRLKWACGANPDLREVFDSYTTSFVSEMESLKNLTAILKSVSSSASSVLHHEALRTTQSRESIAADSAFMALLGDCQQSAALKETHNIGALSEQELSLFTLSPPAGDVIDSHWIRQTEEAISTRVRTAKEQLRMETGKCQALVPSLQQSSRDLVGAITEHQKLMADVGALLKTISKSEDYDIPEVANFLQKYKAFSDLVSQLIRESRQEEQTEASVRQMTTITDKLKELVPTIYDDIVDFSQLFKEENLEAFKVKRSTESRRQDGDEAGKDGGGERSGRLQQQKTSEEKNAFALNVLRRVRFKLEGREPDALKRASVQEQVDFVIREATSLDNLALMYEGWTAWV